MMQPETPDDWQPTSSDDDWSVVDGTESLRNKVAPGKELVEVLRHAR